jgi:hypothetical protein
MWVGARVLLRTAAAEAGDRGERVAFDGLEIDGGDVAAALAIDREPAVARGGGDRQRPLVRRPPFHASMMRSHRRRSAMVARLRSSIAATRPRRQCGVPPT